MKITVPVVLASLTASLLAWNAYAFTRYSGSGTTCATCHGAFDGSTSLKGTVFPSGDKHRMHRSSSYMDTNCDLCHTTEGDNPRIGSSAGTANNPGIGCNGCHVASGLRAHHEANGVTCYTAGCHAAEPTPAESTSPTYYGTVDTKADNPCNDVAAANVNENWSIGDFLGLDHDGNNVYDALDPACTPLHITAILQEGTDVRIVWETAGGRTDVLQTAPSADDTYIDLGAPIVVSGSGVAVTNAVHTGIATNGATRAYRIRIEP